MPTREIIEIDEELCDGCGQCVPGCAEGALQIIDGKARLVADIYCDGLGACLGHCPTGALTIVQREAEPFDEEAVEAMLAQQKSAAQTPHPGHSGLGDSLACGCPSSEMQQLQPTLTAPAEAGAAPRGSALSHWPVQLRLVPPHAPFLKEADVLLLADCGALAVPDLHQRYVPGKVVLMGCPKFDNAEEYVARLKEIFERNQLASLTVLEMEVPCCSGLSKIAARAAGLAGSHTPLTRVVAARDGRELSREQLEPAASAFAMQP